MPAELRRPGRRQPGSQSSSAASGGSGPELHVRVPPLKSLQDGHVQQAVRGFLSDDRLRPALLFPTANAAAPSALRTESKRNEAEEIKADRKGAGKGGRDKLRRNLLGRLIIQIEISHVSRNRLKCKTSTPDFVRDGKTGRRLWN